MATNHTKIEKTRKPLGLFGKILRAIGILILVLILLIAALFAFLSATEYKPKQTSTIKVNGNAEETLSSKATVKVLTWNIGYGALGDNADFFMDGGSMVETADVDRVEENLTEITKEIKSESPDIIMLQEVDQDSKRSHHINEFEGFQGAFPQYTSSFANNFKVAFLPYPVPPIGKVDSGIATFSCYPLASSKREQLPIPFKWPVRMANLKRCVLISRIPLEDSDQELVIMNLHLEAYDSGEGKAAQTEALVSLLQTEKEKGNYVIAGGDFNQIFSSEDNNIYPAQEGKWAAGKIDTSAFDDDLQFLMDESTPTCRSLDQPYANFVGGDDNQDFQFYLIDGFIVSDNLKVKNLKTCDLDFVNSDHNPVVLEVTLK